MFVRNTKSFEIGNMPQKSSEPKIQSLHLEEYRISFTSREKSLSGSHSFDVRNNFNFLAMSVIIPRFDKLSISAAQYFLIYIYT